MNTLDQYLESQKDCKDIFLTKGKDYGLSWRLFRPSSLTDQMMIKTKRLRTIQENGGSVIGEGQKGEFQALVNYGAMAIIQTRRGALDSLDNEDYALLEQDYMNVLTEAQELMLKKNADYGEAWRELRVSSITDLILVKLCRISEIEKNEGKTIISEGVVSNYLDIVNYAIFALILLKK